MKKYSEKKKNSLKKGEGVPLLNFVRGPGVPLSNFQRGPGVPTLKFRGVPGPTFKLLGGPGSRGPGPTFTPCHERVNKKHPCET